MIGPVEHVYLRECELVAITEYGLIAAAVVVVFVEEVTFGDL